jgi:4-alpha-glucanotransferase
VYDARAPDALHAVHRGARLFESPSLSDHPLLARYAIARPEQQNPDPTTRRYADDWVVARDDAQVERYGVQLAVIMAAARAHGRDPSDIICEVLSTQPYPLGRVLARYGLGRFRVTQKANLRDPADVYRSENAAPRDWIMVGNHDTKPLWRIVREWYASGAAYEQADYLAARLAGDEDASALASRIGQSPQALALAKVADLFASRARHVLIFMSDLLGYDEVYNAPGTVSDANWSLRVGPDFARDYADKVARGDALSLPRALAMALRSRGESFVREHQGLVDRLERPAPLG